MDAGLTLARLRLLIWEVGLKASSYAVFTDFLILFIFLIFTEYSVFIPRTEIG